MEISYNNLFTFMLKNNISKSELAEKSEISRNSIIKMAKGGLVHLSVIVAICEAYELPLEFVLQEKR